MHRLCYIFKMELFNKKQKLEFVGLDCVLTGLDWYLYFVIVLYFVCLFSNEISMHRKRKTKDSHAKQLTEERSV